MHPLTMSQGNPGPGGTRRKPKFLSVDQVSADMLHQSLLRRPDIRRLADLETHLPYYANWTRDRLDTAISCLFADGRLTETDGRIVVHPRAVW